MEEQKCLNHANEFDCPSNFDMIRTLALILMNSLALVN